MWGVRGNHTDRLDMNYMHGVRWGFVVRVSGVQTISQRLHVN